MGLAARLRLATRESGLVLVERLGDSLADARGIAAGCSFGGRELATVLAIAIERDAIELAFRIERDGAL
jgi:hypothetical protein